MERRMTKVELPIKDNNEALQKFKDIIKQEFEKEVDLRFKNNADLRERFLKIADNCKTNNIAWFLRKYIIYQLTMNLDIEKLKVYDIFGCLKNDFPLEALNVFINDGHALNLLAANVEFVTPYDSIHGLSSFISPMEFCIFENNVKEKSKRVSKKASSMKKYYIRGLDIRLLAFTGFSRKIGRLQYNKGKDAFQFYTSKNLDEILSIIQNVTSDSIEIVEVETNDSSYPVVNMIVVRMEEIRNKITG